MFLLQSRTRESSGEARARLISSISWVRRERPVLQLPKLQMVFASCPHRCDNVAARGGRRRRSLVSLSGRTMYLRGRAPVQPGGNTPSNPPRRSAVYTRTHDVADVPQTPERFVLRLQRINFTHPRPLFPPASAPPGLSFVFQIIEGRYRETSSITRDNFPPPASTVSNESPLRRYNFHFDDEIPPTTQVRGEVPMSKITRRARPDGDKSCNDLTLCMYAVH